MDANEIEQVTRLVSLQLQQAAAEQATERENIYKMLAGLVEVNTKLAKNISTMSTDNDKRTVALMETFAQQFVERVVPVIVQQVNGNTTSKTSPAMNEVVADAIVTGTKDLLRRSLEPLAQRITSIEQRLPRDR